MRSKTTGGVIVSYPDLLLPIFNRGVVKVTNINTEVITTITAKEKTYTDVRQPFEGVVELDVSPYHHVFFVDALTELEQSRNFRSQIVVKTYIDNVETILLEDEFVPIFGASSYLYPLGHSPRQRYYPNHPVRYDFIGTAEMALKFGGAGTQVVMKDGVTSITMMALFVEDEKFATVTQINRESGEVIAEHEFIRDERTDGVFIRWIDSHSCYRYYVMDEGAVTITAKDKGEQLYTDFMVETLDGGINTYFSKPQGVTSTVSKKFCASFTDEKDRELLSTLQTASLIWMRDRSDFIPITLKRGSFSNTKGIADVEFEFFLPSEPDMSV